MDHVEDGGGHSAAELGHHAPTEHADQKSARSTHHEEPAQPHQGDPPLSERSHHPAPEGHVDAAAHPPASARHADHTSPRSTRHEEPAQPLPNATHREPAQQDAHEPASHPTSALTSARLPLADRSIPVSARPVVHPVLHDPKDTHIAELQARIKHLEEEAAVRQASVSVRMLVVCIEFSTLVAMSPVGDMRKERLSLPLYLSPHLLTCFCSFSSFSFSCSFPQVNPTPRDHDLAAQLRALTDSHAALEARLATSHASHAALEAQLAATHDTSSRPHTLEVGTPAAAGHDVTLLEQRVAELEAAASAHHVHETELLGKLAEAQAQHASDAEHLRVVQAEHVEQLHAHQAAHAGAISASAEHKDELANALAQAQADAATAQAELASFQSQVAALTHANAAHEDTIASQAELIRQLQQENEVTRLLLILSVSFSICLFSFHLSCACQKT